MWIICICISFNFLQFTDQVLNEKINPFHFFIFLTWYENATYTGNTSWYMNLIGDLINIITTLSKNSFRSLNYTLSMWLKWWCHLSDNFVKGDHWSEFQLCNVMEVEIPRRVVWRLHIPPSFMNYVCCM